MALPEIYATENDIGGSGLGRDLREKSWRNMVGKYGISFVLTGMVPNTSGTLTFTLNSNGEAIIAGHYVKNAEMTVVCTANVRNYIWLKLVKSGDNVTGLTLEARTSNDVPSGLPGEFMKICEAVCGASSITSVEDRRPATANEASGKFTGTGSALNVIIGFQPKRVTVFDFTAGTTAIIHSILGDSTAAQNTAAATANMEFVANGFVIDTVNSRVYRFYAET